MNARVAVLGTGLLTLACSSAEAPPPAPMTVAERAGVCEGIHNFYECSRAVERNLLAATDAAVRRAGDTLIIGLVRGDAKTLVDHGTDAETVLYTYGGYLDQIRHHAVTVHFYEGSAYTLIDETTGQETRMAARPVVSPDGRRAVVVSYEGMAGYAPNLLQIWRAAPDGLVMEWELTPDDWGAEEARWADATTVRFTKLSMCEGLRPCETEATLRLEGGEWAVVDEPTR